MGVLWQAALMEALRDAALGAVAPGAAVDRALAEVDPARLPTHWVAVGKAAVAMAEAALAWTPEAPAWVIAPRALCGASALPERAVVWPGDHPLPTRANVEATAQLLAALDAARPARLGVLLSGGASALLTSPAEGVSLEALEATTAALMEGGAPIEALNAVRKHLSRVKGGQMALRRPREAEVAVWVISDVLGDRLDVIGSGPWWGDASSWSDAAEAVARYDLEGRVPEAVRARLRRGMEGALEETPAPDDARLAGVQHTVIARRHDALDAAAAAAREAGWSARVLGAEIEGEAREVGRALASAARDAARGARPVWSGPLASVAGALEERLGEGERVCWLGAGESTVTVRGGGVGGRNQEVALAAAQVLDGVSGVGLAALATDGVDGPTDAAGAHVDGATAQRLRARGRDVGAALDANASWSCLEGMQEHWRIGPTGTNVCDVFLVLIERGV